MTCKYEQRCMNNDKCYRCFNNKLLKLPEDKLKRNKNNVYNYSKANVKDSWKDLEQHTANCFNNVPTIKQAKEIANSESFKNTIRTAEEMVQSRRTRRSGAMWFETGDVKDSIMHPECKERTGRELKSGDKSMSIQKHWLTKAKEECRGTNKKMCLPFRFKGDNNTYVIMDLDDLAELVTMIKAYKIEIEALGGNKNG